MMPSGTPIARAMATATIISDSVIIVSSQNPSTPQPASASTPAAAARVPPVRHPISPTSVSTPGQRSPRSTASTASVARCKASEIGSKIRVNNQCRSLLRTVQS